MIIGNKYEITEKLGEGSFGQIYKAFNIRTHEQVAIKFELIESNNKMLKRETKIYNYLAKNKQKGIPQVKWFGIDDSGKYQYMVLTLLGESLQKIKNKKGSFSLETTLKIGIKIIEIIEQLHENGFVHRDIKCDNFLVGNTNNKNDIYIIDFGFCKKYVDENNNHNNIKKISQIIGTPKFISINVHNLIEPSRRDDVESLIYILMYLYYGTLTWENDSDLEIIKIKKENIPNLEYVFKRLLDYIKTLEFNERPNYECIKSLMKDKLERK